MHYKKVQRFNDLKLIKNEWKLNNENGVTSDVGKGSILMFERVVSFG